MGGKGHACDLPSNPARRGSGHGLSLVPARGGRPPPLTDLIDLARSCRTGDHGRVAEVACQVVRRVADGPWPGLVEAQLTDSDGRVWSFTDKEPVFCSQEIGRLPRFPVAAAIQCQVVGHEVLADGREAVTVDTGRPDGVDSGGVTIFRVPASAVSG